MTSDSAVQIIIPAHNESGFLGHCLDAVLAQDYQGAAHVIVVANGCTDDTAARAASFGPALKARGWRLTVAELPEGGKVGALNHGDRLAGEGARIYLDADIQMAPELLSGIAAALATDQPRYAGGRLVVARSESPVSRAYARFWQRLPFVTTGVTGAGLFAVNPAGRARWGAFPGIISDDTFVRLQFSEDERILVNEAYHWPIAEGFSRLVRVRRRQDNGVSEIARLYPELLGNQGHDRPSRGELVRLALRDPIGFSIYAAVAVAVRSGRNRHDWARGR
ncbi:glycosyltransferase family 2 protein [Paracoccus aminophilus]|uniref:Glycosyl transferase n=1 Tax=Paracoccus aminophilus JCM 7686 TaxID=1367847 RepID=S5YFB6_PARAH|nr:glycosyltransferase [Paracoccus aminophilus]AGT10168.1 glycosyl transferase [Paracoccus aminophilus JCM 7686]